MIGVAGPVLLTVGYEGRTVDEVVATLQAVDVTTLVDVRLNPLSRKPGLSKRRLAERLERAGIRYVHLPSLGNPKDNRESLRANEPAAVDRFRGLLRTEPGTVGLDTVAGLAGDGTVALLCVERDARHCHRELIAARLTELNPGLTVRHV